MLSTLKRPEEYLNKLESKIMSNPFRNYRESYIIRDNIKSKHIIAGRHSYYAGYHEGRHFEDNVMYLDEIDNKYLPEEIDQLIIGSFCSIASGVKFMMCGTQGHNYRWIATHPLQGFSDDFFPGHCWKGDTIIGNDVWLGAESLIMPGIQISDGAIVAARSVVTKNIGPYEIWGGNPACFIKKRFMDNEIEKLLQIKWWDWSDEKIKANIKYLRSANIEDLWRIFKGDS